MLTDFATLSPSDTLAGRALSLRALAAGGLPRGARSAIGGHRPRQRILEALRSDGNGYVQSVMSRAFQVARPEDTLGTTIRRLTAGHGLALIPITERAAWWASSACKNLMSSMSLLAEQRRIERQEANE